MLEVVEEEQQLFPTERAGEILAHADGAGDFRRHDFGIGESRKRNPEDAVAEATDELCRYSEREPCLPRPTGPRDRDEARAVREHGHKLLELALPPEERGRRHR
ncbi:hypothetical protein BH20ACT14_BH20ACT14_17800 [soil metagenome]